MLQDRHIAIFLHDMFPYRARNLVNETREVHWWTSFSKNLTHETLEFQLFEEQHI